jgi:hypothetical protein
LEDLAVGGLGNPGIAVRGLYAELANMAFCEIRAITESVSYVFSTSMSGSTPAASTNNMFIFNSLQAKSIKIAKNIATHKLFRIK